MSDELYTLEVCARKAGVSVSTIKREIVCGKLVPTRVRGRVKIHPADWEGYLQQCRSVARGEDGKSGFNMPAGELADLFRAVGTLPNLSAEPATVSRIIALDGARRTRSKKRSIGG